MLELLDLRACKHFWMILNPQWVDKIQGMLPPLCDNSSISEDTGHDNIGHILN